MQEKKIKPAAEKEGESRACYHCGEKTLINPIYYDDKLFCCEGCKTVYSLLKANHMEAYYQLDESPGISLRHLQISPNTYAVLDAPDILDKMLTIRTEKHAKVTLRLPNIHCASCLWLLENLYKMQPGIISSRVNFMAREATISYDPRKISLRQVAQLLAAIGYPPELSLGSTERRETRLSRHSRRMLYRLGVAGFAFGNIMLTSFPDYLNMGHDHKDIVLQVLPYINMTLAVPMVFYSGWDYLESAWKGIRSGYLNMDVPISLGILALFFRSVYEVLVLGETGYFDSLAGLVFFLLVGKWFQDRTYRRIAFDRDYRSYFPIWATKLTAEGEQAVPLDRLAKGDHILVRNGEMIPADGTLVHGTALVDYSFVTGESDPVRLEVGERVYAGGYQQGPAIEVELTATVSQSYLTGLWNNEAFVKRRERPASALSDAVGRRFTYVVLTIAVLTLLYWLPRDWSMAVYAFTSVLIVACPCAISLSIPFTLGNVLSVLGRHKIYLKNTMVIEDLATINHIVFDKTGTLTHKTIRVEGALSDYHLRLVKTLVSQSNHPVSRLLYREIDAAPFEAVYDFEERPGEGLSGEVDGHRVEVVSGAFVGERTGTVLRVDGETVGRVFAEDRLRAGVRELFERLRSKYQLSLISGDNDAARDLMQSLFGDEAHVLFRQRPEDKLEYIRSLQAKGDKVLMVGDGLNDAGALQLAEVGMVLTESGNNFTPASDVILSSRFLPRLDELLNLSADSIRIIYKGYLFALVYNIIGLSFAVRGLLSPVIAAILMPMSSITVVLIGVVLSTLRLKKLRFSAK